MTPPPADTWSLRLPDQTNERVRVLYIEDDPAATLLVRAGLESGPNSRFQFDAVGTLGDAVAKLGVNEYDVVLLDLGLPDSEGMSTLTSIRRASPEIPVVVLTAHSFGEMGIAALHNGADEFLEKEHFDGMLLTRLMMFAIERRRLLEAVSRHQRHVETAEVERNRLVEAVRQVDDLVIITDVHGTIQYTNPAFERITGYSTEEAVGQTPTLLQGGVTSAATYEELWATLMSKKTWRGRFVNRRKDGTLYSQESVLSPIRNPQGEVVGFVGLGRDVTVEREIEARLRQSQKLQVVGQLAAGVAHDFNNMLAVILTVAGIARQDLETDASRVGADLDEIILAARRAEGIVARLLGFSRQAPLRLQATSLNELVRGTLGMIRATLPTSITLESHIEDNLPDVLVDLHAVEQILLNLVTNARDAMPEMGELRIAVEAAELDTEFAKSHPGVRAGVHVCISVTDTGTGFGREVQDQIFTPLFTTKPEGEGTGLGLALVSGLMTQHSGAVHVSSELGRGSVFKLYFPALRERRKRARPELPALPLITTAGEVVLLVEDNDALRRVARRVLERAGYKVRVAVDGQEGLDVYRAGGQEIDVIVTDSVMPRMGGCELLAAVREENTLVPFVVTSGYLRRMHEGDEVPPRGVVYLPKPWSIEDLLRCVRASLDRRDDAASA